MVLRIEYLLDFVLLFPFNKLRGLFMEISSMFRCLLIRCEQGCMKDVMYHSVRREFEAIDNGRDLFEHHKGAILPQG